MKKLTNYLIQNDLIHDVYLSILEEIFFRPKDPNDLQNWCGGTGHMISADHTGNIYPCIRYMPNSLGNKMEPLTIGHVSTGIQKEAKHQDCAACLKKIDRRTQSTDECFDCPIAEGCSWCSAYNYQVFGTADKRATFICVMHKARALANAYYWNKRYQKLKENKRHKLWIPKDWAVPIIGETEWSKLKELEMSSKNSL